MSKINENDKKKVMCKWRSMSPNTVVVDFLVGFKL